VLDRWGLLQHRTELEVARLQVIPRARYALWLARRYLETSKTGGAIPTALSLAVSRRTIGSRAGIEYYGSRSYQPGDSLRSIDWKRSLKLDEIVVKEYDLPRVTAALLLVNAAAASAGEADRLVHAWLTTAITLARESVPAVLAVYDQRQVLAATGFLGPRELVSRSLALSGHVTVWPAPVRYLRAAPDPVRLRASSRRLKAAGGNSAARLAELLDVEFAALRQLAVSSPATWALSRALQKASTRPTVLFLSARNHDAEALAVARYDLAARQYDCAEVSLSAGIP
jgi:uncharacterized protein (DUF58 family)